MQKVKQQHGGYRSGAGRPPVEDPKKNRSIKFTDTEWENVKKKASALKLTASDYVREKALGE